MTVFNFRAVKGWAKVKVFFQIAQSYGVYVTMYMIDYSIPFARDHAALYHIAIIFLFANNVTKLVVCNMGKMDYPLIHLEYLVFGVYFYFQYNYEQTPEYDLKIKYSFYATLVTLILLYVRFSQVCISQISGYLQMPIFYNGKNGFKSVKDGKDTKGKGNKKNK